MKLEYRRKHAETADVTSFYFHPPEPCAWIAGQSIKLELPAGYGVEERRFTISSAPYEKLIRITTRVSDSKFKQALNSLRPGDEVRAFSIEGSLVWQEAELPHLFVALGIGITPYMSMLRQRIFEKRPLSARVVYVASPEKHVFREELERLAREYEEFSVEFVHQSTVENIIGEGLIYLCGPSQAVDELAVRLEAQAVEVSRIRRDWFTGRAGWDADKQ